MKAPGLNEFDRVSSRSQPSMGWSVLGLAAFALYGFATLVPRGDTWGLHALAYMPRFVQVIGLVVCLGLLWPPLQVRVVGVLDRMSRPLLVDARSGNLLLVALGTVAFLLYYCFPIQTEVYGDTRTIIRHWTENAGISKTWLSSLLDLRLEHNDAALTEVLLRTISQSFSIPITQAFRVTSALSGALCLVLWTLFVRSTFSHSRWAGLLLLVGYAAGANQIFFGHVETYAFVFLTMLMFLVAGYLSLERKVSPWLVCLLFAFSLRAHAAAILFMPALAFLAATWLARRHPRMVRALGWRSVVGALVIPALIGGLGLYLFHFKAVAAPYAGAGGSAPPVFLPLVPARGPWDYSLFSLGHLVDFGNAFLLVGMPVALILAGAVLLQRRSVDWGSPAVIYGVLASLFPLLFFFAVNPLLSWPRDWDLFALLGAPLLVFAAAVLGASDDSVATPPVYGSALAFSVFSIGFWVLNATPGLLSPRLEQVGEHVFRTYHSSASYLIGTAQAMEPDTTRSIARRVATIRRLAPAAGRGDEEYAHLLMMLAAVYRERGERLEAVSCVDRVASIAPDDLNMALFRVDYLLWADQPQRAQSCVDSILQRSPANFDALVLGAETAARERDYERALAYLRRAAAARPGDQDVALWTANMKARQTSLAAAPSGRQDMPRAEPEPH